MQAVILAGGEGGRLRPLTHNRPKVMVPVANRPIIDYVIGALAENGIRDIIVVVGYRKEQVIRHLNSLDIPVRVVVQEKQLGVGDALRCARPYIRGDFLLLPGDNYIDVASIERIKDKKHAMLIAEHPYPSNYGVVRVRDGHVTGMIEKPEDSPRISVSTGIFAMDLAVFDYLDEGEIPLAVERFISQGGKIEAIQTEGWHDAVYPWDLFRMNMMVMDRISREKSGTIGDNVVISGNVSIGRGSVIHPNTTISGPVIIGEGCSVGPNVSIMPYTSIGSRVKVDPFTVIGNSIVMDDVRIGSHSRIVDSFIGEGSTLADHTTTTTGIFSADEGGEILRGKFGAILGDRVHSSPFTVFKKTMVGNSVSIEEGRIITGMLPDHVVVK